MRPLGSRGHRGLTALDLVLQTHLLSFRLIAEKTKQKEGREERVFLVEASLSPVAQRSPQLEEVTQLGVKVGLLLSDVSDETTDERERRRSIITLFL